MEEREKEISRRVSEIEKREASVIEKEKELIQREVEVAQKQAEISHHKASLYQKESNLARKEAQLSEKEAQILQKMMENSTQNSNASPLLLLPEPPNISQNETSKKDQLGPENVRILKAIKLEPIDLNSHPIGENRGENSKIKGRKVGKEGEKLVQNEIVENYSLEKILEKEAPELLANLLEKGIFEEFETAGNFLVDEKDFSELKHVLSKVQIC